MNGLLLLPLLLCGATSAVVVDQVASADNAFNFTFFSGSQASSLPADTFAVRKVQFVYYPPDGRTYAYADVVNYTDPFYPVSYSSEVGVFSSPDGFSEWEYHGIVVPRGEPGSWDSDGIASPGAAVAADGTVLVGYAGEHSPSGGANRGIGLAFAPHPLGPFTKRAAPVASPSGICGGTGRCDDVIMQSRPGNAIHLYYSVKDSNLTASCATDHCIRHVVSTDAGQTWSTSSVVLTRTGTLETFAGKWFPRLNGGQGAMVLITDGAEGNTALSCFISDATSADAMLQFVPAAPATLQAHPPQDATKIVTGNWAAEFGRGQVAFVPDSAGNVNGVSFALWTDTVVGQSRGYTPTVFRLKLGIHT